MSPLRWLRQLRRTRRPDPETILQSLVARHGPPEPDFDLAVYRQHADLAHAFTQDWQFLAHYLETGRYEDRQIKAGPDASEADRLRLAERLDLAAEVLRAAAQSRPRSPTLRLRLAEMLFVLGEPDEARQALALPALRRTAADEVENLLAAGRYVEAMPATRARSILDALPTRIPYLDTASVAERILAAKAQRTPFALIRLGDGEGACLRLDEADEAEYQPLYARNRQTFTQIWFGPDFQADETGFTALAAQLPDVIREVDIVGVPYHGWVEHEYRHGILQGIACLGNVLRWLEREVGTMAAAGQALCIQLIHVDLGQSSFFETLLRGEAEIGLISCHGELPGLLASMFGIERVEFHKIPGERQSGAIIGEDALAGEHFPGVFNEISAKLARPLSGKIFLVAGGLLGKFYAATIRRHGGIAIDVGSLADVWVRKATRPGYESLGNLALDG